MISGSCIDAFGAVREAFAANFAERGEVGGAVCVIVDGQVVDLAAQPRVATAAHSST